MTKVSRLARSFKAIGKMMTGLREFFYFLALHFFKDMNRKNRSRLRVWYMRKETSEHVDLLIKVFKWVVLPVSLLYVCANLYLFGSNALESVLWGALIFFYSSFLPDLPSIFGRKKNSRRIDDLPWYEKYALLLLAPIFIWALFSGIQLRWKTAETFHNFKSLTIYGGFLVLFSFLAFVDFPVSIGNLTEIVCPPLLGVIGYLTHLKVDKIW